jgi:hypothetical protein
MQQQQQQNQQGDIANGINVPRESPSQKEEQASGEAVRIWEGMGVSREFCSFLRKLIRKLIIIQNIIFKLAIKSDDLL